VSQQRFGYRLVALLTALPLLALAAACASSNNNGATKNAGSGASAPAAPVSASLTPAAGGAATAVNIQGIAFPATITVKPGTAVTWTNRDTVSHTVTSDAGQAQSFDSNTIAPNGTFSVTFAKAGTYTYHCNIHASMHGTVVVSDQPAGAATPAGATPRATGTAYDPGYKY
jgi:plastocyanin